MKKYAIIVAGGIGKRMGSEIPKQFLLLDGLPILMHTISQFYNYDKEISLIIVLPKEQINYWDNLCKEYNFNVKHNVIAGGETRYVSVKNGLAIVKGEGIIAIHDGVRPLVSYETIDRCFKIAGEKGNAVPFIKVKESLRKISNETNIAVNREKFALIQTPQVFCSNIILNAYKKEYQTEFTDDASLVEFTGEKINLVEGNEENIKITSQSDILIAEVLSRNSIKKG